MIFAPPLSNAARSAVVDLGSNSVRLVVFEGNGRNPSTVFNEKAVLRLGRGLQATGRLNEEAVPQALMVMNRYGVIARAMGADPFEVLATAAVRDATNGPAFVAALEQRLPGVAIRILSGEEEAAYATAGLLCGIPDADGVLADIGGGSLELVRVARGGGENARSLPLGVIRLAERSEGDPLRARAIAESDLANVPWLNAAGEGRDLYLVGGAWRALARIHMTQLQHPLNIVHYYAIPREAARQLAGDIAAASRRTLERLSGAPRRRVEDLPFAGVVLRRLLRATGVRRVVFSANGLREGWYMDRVAAATRSDDPLLSAARDLGRSYGRNTALPTALLNWTDPLFPDEPPSCRRLREAACWLSDIGSHDHPEYRAEQAFLRVLRQPEVGIDHAARAFVALVLAVRYEAEPDSTFLLGTRPLLSPDAVQRAVVLGCALRVAYTLSAGTPDLLAGTALDANARLTLRLAPGSGVFAGESVTRRLDRLAMALGMPCAVEETGQLLQERAK